MRYANCAAAISLLVITSYFVTSNASEISVADAPPVVYQLAKQPVAVVDNGKCEVRGAVWASGPRPGVNISLTSADGQVYTTKTNAAGIYAVSLPYAGTTTAYEERITDPVYVRPELAEKARVLSPPPIVCSKERTAAFLQSINSRSK